MERRPTQYPTQYPDATRDRWLQRRADVRELRHLRGVHLAAARAAAATPQARLARWLAQGAR